MSPAVRAPVFGRQLEDSFKDNHGACPVVFADSLKLLREGLDTPGLFRQTANRKKKVQLLQRAWEQGRNPLKLAKIHDFAAVSDCLLNWLISLPSPLIPCKLFQAFIHVHEKCSHSHWVRQIRLLFDKLSHQESEICLPLLAFLHEYDHCQRCNDFRVPSLGHIFGPVLLKAHTQALPLPFPEEVKAVAALVDCIIAEYDRIFRPPPSPTSSPVKKPPPRAKVFSPTRKPLAPLVQLGNEQQNEKRQLFSARMFPVEAPPLMHLQISVPHPWPHDENKCGNLPHSFENSSDLHGSYMSTIYGLRCSPRQEEVDSGVEQEDRELDSVVGDLLCGSLSGMLFDPDDQRFSDLASRASSGMTSPNSPCQQSEGSTDSSCDEDFAHFNP